MATCTIEMNNNELLIVITRYLTKSPTLDLKGKYE